MKKHLSLRIALAVLFVLVGVILPATASAEGNANVYVYGHVWDETNQKGITGVTVELWRDGVKIGSSTTTSGNGDFGFGVRPQQGEYTIKLVQPLPAGFTSVAVEANNTRITTPSDSITERFFGRLLRAPFNVNVGPVNFMCSSDYITPPPTQGPYWWSYVHGQVVKDRAPAPTIFDPNAEHPIVLLGFWDATAGGWNWLMRESRLGRQDAVYAPVSAAGYYGTGISFRPWRYIAVLTTMEEMTDHDLGDPGCFQYMAEHYPTIEFTLSGVDTPLPLFAPVP